jgi:hypothetical protein
MSCHSNGWQLNKKEDAVFLFRNSLVNQQGEIYQDFILEKKICPSSFIFFNSEIE